MRKRRRDGAKEAYWRGQVEKQARSGLGVRAFCRQQGLAENSFYAWRRELAVRDRESAVVRAPSALQAERPRTPFTEVVLTAPAERLPATPTLEIILTPGSSRAGSPGNQLALRIAISPGFDPATLAAVLDVLEQRPC